MLHVNHLLPQLIFLFSSSTVMGFQSFPPPTFQSSWLEVSSTSQLTSYRVIQHGLGTVPGIVKVFVRAIDGLNEEFVFEATSSAQVDSDLDIARGGVFYAYSDTDVFLWSVTPWDPNTQSYALFVGGAWGGGRWNQLSYNVLVQVQVWSMDDFYESDFISSPFQMMPKSYMEINHGLGILPMWVKVRGSFFDQEISKTLYLDGTGSQQFIGNGMYDQTSGIMFAYDETSVRLWTNRYLFNTDDGWSFEKHIKVVTAAKVQVFVWSSVCITPKYDSDWIHLDQSLTTSYELNYTTCNTVRHVDVQLKATDGKNMGFVFRGTGMCQSTGQRRPSDKAGGVVFAHTHNTVRVWLLSPGPTTAVITVYGWGGGMTPQQSSKGDLRVRVWCENPSGTPFCHRSYSKRWLLHKGKTSLQHPLVKLRSMTASLVRCAGFCVQERMCTTLSNVGGICTLYGDFQFGGSVPDQPSLNELYQKSNPSFCGL